MTSLILYGMIPLAMLAVALITRVAQSPLSWLFGPWVLVFLPIWTGVIEYHNPPIGAFVEMFVVFHLCVIYLGYISVFIVAGYPRYARALLSPPQETRARELRQLGPLVDFVVAMGCLGSILFLVDAFVVSGFAGAENALEVRTSFIEADTSWLGRLAPILAWGSFLAIISICWFGPKLLGGRLIPYIVSIVLLAGFSYLSAGRQIVFQILLFSLIGWLILRRPTNFRSVKPKVLLYGSVIIIMAVVAFGYMANLFSNRESADIASVSEYLLFIFGAELNDNLRQLLSGASDEFQTMLVGSIIYFSSQLSSLSAFLLPEAQDTMAIGKGGIQFPWLYRRLVSLGLPSFEEFMQIRRSYLSSRGYMSVSWSTALGTFLNDFGFFGAFLFSYFVGVVGGQVLVGYQRKPSVFSFGLLIASYVYLFYLILLPASAETMYFFLIIGLFLLQKRYVRTVSGEIHFRSFRIRIA